MTRKKIDKKPTFEELDKKMKELQIQKSLLLDSSLSGENVEDIIKAQAYIEKKKKDKKSEPKAFLFNPDGSFYNGAGFKTSLKGVTFEFLRTLSKVHVIDSIITTRIQQIENFLEYSKDNRDEGWTIRPKKGLYDDPKELTDQDKQRCSEIAEWIQNGGFSKWDIHDDFDDFVRKIIRDSLTFDQLAFECERNLKGDLIHYMAIDAGSIRFLETIDKLYTKDTNYQEINGQLPRFCQIYAGNICKTPEGVPVIYYPWELGFGIRNKTTDIRSNGYGVSELETLVTIIEWLLFGMYYNGNFFKQGSNPKGFLNIKGEDIDQNVLNDFRQTWRETLVGVQNSHKIPVLSGLDVQWIDLQKNNRDMEFHDWNDFLTILTCSVYKIDPSEVGFHFKNQGEVFGQDGQKERLNHSRQKGLVPLLKFSQKIINKFLVSEIDERFEFAWTGINREDEVVATDLKVKKLNNGLKSFEDTFREENGRDYDPEKDTILNPEFINAKNLEQQQAGGQNNNEEGAPDTNENYFDKFGKAIEDESKSDPILSETLDYIEKQLHGNKH